MIRSAILTMTLAVLGVAWAPVGFAETDKPEKSAPEQSASPEKAAPAYSEEDLRSFAVALLEVGRIKTSYAPKVAQNLRELEQVKRAAAQEMVQALKEQGMSVDKYQEMLNNAQASPELADKVDHYLREAAKQKSPDQESPSGKGSGDESGDQDQPAKPRSPQQGEKV